MITDNIKIVSTESYIESDKDSYKDSIEESSLPSWGGCQMKI